MERVALHKVQSVSHAQETDIIIPMSENAMTAVALTWSATLQVTASIFFAIHAVH